MDGGKGTRNSHRASTVYQVVVGSYNCHKKQQQTQFIREIIPNSLNSLSPFSSGLTSPPRRPLPLLLYYSSVVLVAASIPSAHKQATIGVNCYPLQFFALCSTHQQQRQQKRNNNKPTPGAINSPNCFSLSLSFLLLGMHCVQCGRPAKVSMQTKQIHGYFVTLSVICQVFLDVCSTWREEGAQSAWPMSSLLNTLSNDDTLRIDLC